MRKALAPPFISFTFFLCIVSAATDSFGQKEIVGISIACSNDRVYTWYSDRTVSVGNSENLSAHEPPHPYSLPFGKTPSDIVEIGIASNDRVYTWFKDKTVSSGTSTDLDKYQPRHPYRLPSFGSPDSVVGIDIACSNDHVYVWYSSGYISAGTSEDLDKYINLPPRLFGVGLSQNRVKSIEGIGIAGNDHVYAWYRDRKVSSGTSTSLASYRSPYDYVLGPGPCDISADPPKIKGSVVFAVGIRGPTCKAPAEIIVRLKSVDSTVNSILFAGKRVTGVNFEVPITYSCSGNRGLTVRTEVESQGRIVRSKDTKISACF